MKSIISIFLAMLVLASNSGAIIATHYCMGKIAEVNIGFEKEAHDCNMANMDDECNHDKRSDHKGCSVEPVDCCADDFMQIELNEPFDAPVYSNFDIQFLVAFTSTYNNLYNFISEPETNYKNYSPPLLEQNFPVLFQTFLI